MKSLHESILESLTDDEIDITEAWEVYESYGKYIEELGEEELLELFNNDSNIVEAILADSSFEDIEEFCEEVNAVQVDLLVESSNDEDEEIDDEDEVEEDLYKKGAAVAKAARVSKPAKYVAKRVARAVSDKVSKSSRKSARRQDKKAARLARKSSRLQKKLDKTKSKQSKAQKKSAKATDRSKRADAFSKKTL